MPVIESPKMKVVSSSIPRQFDPAGVVSSTGVNNQTPRNNSYRGHKIIFSLIFLFTTITISGGQTKPIVVVLKSVNGKELKAKILRATGESITLERADRQVFTVPMTRFDIDSQKVIAVNLLRIMDVVPIPEIDARLFIPRSSTPDELAATVYVAIAQSKNHWWPRLHVGGFSDKPADFVSIVFKNAEGKEVKVNVPSNTVTRGSKKGGKKWTAREFFVEDAVLKQLVSLDPSLKNLTLHGIDIVGDSVELPRSSLDELGASIAIYLRVNAFASAPDFGIELPSEEDFSDQFFFDASLPPHSEQFHPTKMDGKPLEETVRRFNLGGKVQTADSSGNQHVWPLTEFQLRDRAELMSRLLSSGFSFSQNEENNFEYYTQNGMKGTTYLVPNLKLGREIGKWRPAIWLKVPIADLMGERLKQIRIYVDKNAPFTLSSKSLTFSGKTSQGVNYYSTSFHAGSTMGGKQAELLQNAHTIRFQLIEETESYWVEAKPREVAQMRDIVILYRIMKELDNANAPVRQL